MPFMIDDLNDKVATSVSAVMAVFGQHVRVSRLPGMPIGLMKSFPKSRRSRRQRKLRS